MLILDAHCDTITKIMETKENLMKNNCHIDLERLKRAGEYIQFFAAFIEPEKSRHPMRRAIQVIDKYHEQIGLYQNEIKHCNDFDEIMEALGSKESAAFLTIEGGDCLEGDLSALRMFYKLGVRSLILTWNHRNEIADGVGEEAGKGGLTDFGREVVAEMNRLGMIVDVSHLSEIGFWNVIELTKAPIIASHSNAKKICGHRRNLSDEQIMAIKKNNGVIGINLYPDFLSDEKKAGLKDVIAHIEHIAALTGNENVGLGADFDGIETVPENICGAQDVAVIFNELLKLNYPQSFIENFAGQNFLRVIKEVC